MDPAPEEITYFAMIWVEKSENWLELRKLIFVM